MKTDKLKFSNSSILTIFTIAILGIVIYVGNIMTVNTSKITDAICLVAFTVMPIQSIICAICFLIPLHSGITGLYIYGYAVLMILVKSKKYDFKILIPLLVIILYEIIMMAVIGLNQINLIIVYTLAIFLLLYMANTDDISPKPACISYVCGTVVLLLCIFTTAVQNNSLELVLSGVVRIGKYEGAGDVTNVAIVTENANAMAYYAIVAIAIALTCLKNVKLGGKILLITAIVFLTIISLFTVSRTFIIILTILLVLALIFSRNFKQKIKYVIGVVLVLVIVIPYLQQETQIFDAFLMRFEEDNMATATGRTNIFWEYMQFLWDNPLRLIFGTGSVFYRQVCDLSHSMHNGVQQILVSYGILGFIPMLIVFISPILNHFKKNKFTFNKLLPVLAVVMFIQTIQFLNPTNLMLPYAIAILCMKIPDSEYKQ